MSKKNPLPKGFSCGGHEFNVIRMPGLIKLAGDMGQTRFNENEVLVDAALTGDQMWHTYYHEVMHVLMTSIGRQDLNNDEAFIDMVASLLYQIQKTSTYE